MAIIHKIKRLRKIFIFFEKILKKYCLNKKYM
jgi:hypothetical protein